MAKKIYPQEKILCACGCGKEIFKFDQHNGRLRKYMVGHYATVMWKYSKKAENTAAMESRLVSNPEVCSWDKVDRRAVAELMSRGATKDEICKATGLRKKGYAKIKQDPEFQKFMEIERFKFNGELETLREEYRAKAPMIFKELFDIIMDKSESRHLPSVISAAKEVFDRTGVESKKKVEVTKRTIFVDEETSNKLARVIGIAKRISNLEGEALEQKSIEQ